MLFSKKSTTKFNIDTVTVKKKEHLNHNIRIISERSWISKTGVMSAENSALTSLE